VEKHHPGDRQGCMKGTRRDVLLGLEKWLEDEQAPRVFRLNGSVGSATAQTSADICFIDGTLSASFFCLCEFYDRSNDRLILPTIAFQLAHRYPQLLKLLRTYPDIGQESLDSQMEKLIICPFEATQIQTLIVINVLDECKDQVPHSAILVLLSKSQMSSSSLPDPLRVGSSTDSACHSTPSEKRSSLVFVGPQCEVEGHIKGMVREFRITRAKGPFGMCPEE